MLESIRQFYDIAVDFCREQSEILMIGGAALVVLIILIAVIRHCTRGRRGGDDLEFDEQRYLDELLGARAEKKEKAESAEKAEKTEKPENTEKAAGAESQPYKKNIILPDELLEEISRASAQNLQEVQIKIQSAELRIRYAGYRDRDGESAQVHEEVFHFDKTPEPAAETEEAINAQPAVEPAEAQAELAESEPESASEILQEKLQPQQIARAERPAVKFGPDNLNTARDGRIYTEEELEKQIRD